MPGREMGVAVVLVINAVDREAPFENIELLVGSEVPNIWVGPTGGVTNYAGGCTSFVIEAERFAANIRARAAGR